ncbi:MAG: class I SAM-dependent DNA methyltransferase [Cyclobacteriaceae bacterium]
MAIKKSELYSSLWASCDALRGGMDASQYKDYVLILLFVKYVSDRYGNDPNALIEIPKGGSFKDIAAMKGQKDIGEKMDIAIGQLAKSNDLENVIDVISFNDEEKLGKGKEMVDRLSKLVAIFENPALNFSKNRAQGDDILGDAYEYLMRHFATESGKSKGQFYTPAEVSRIMAKVIGIGSSKSQSQTIYDYACGSGSLLLKAADEANHPVTIYGQEKDVATAALSRMNMILHNNPTAEIVKGQSTISNPLFLDDKGNLKSFDYVVANPPFSLANWMDGFDAYNDEHNRFDGYGIPPEKNGDYAWLLHTIKSLKSTGTGAVILPHGVLFRGGSEGTIRKNIITKGYIKGIIGLPANLFYGTGIPACIIVIDKKGAANRKGIFMIDAGKAYMKDGNKNRLREQDIHKIVDVFNNLIEVPKYSGFISNEEIADPKNDYNLNIPRYIDSQEPEDIQDIEAHLLGDIPNADIEALEDYWNVYPSLRKGLFGKSKRANYSQLKTEKDQIKNTIFNHPEFIRFSEQMDSVFNGWKKRTTKKLKTLTTGFKPKEMIHQISEDLLEAYSDIQLIDKYDAYQHTMNYWMEVMQDDCYIVTVDGWKAEVYRVMVENKKGVQVDKGWACDLIPAELIVNRYFLKERNAITQLEADRDALAAKLEELEEEHSGEEGYFASIEKVNKANVQKRLKEIKKDKGAKEEVKILETYLELTEEQGDLNTKIKVALAELDKNTLAKYPKLSDEEIKQLVVDDKWMSRIETSIKSEMERISQRLTQRIKELAERYETPMPLQTKEVAELEKKVDAHLKKMGFVWK